MYTFYSFRICKIVFEIRSTESVSSVDELVTRWLLTLTHCEDSVHGDEKKFITTKQNAKYSRAPLDFPCALVGGRQRAITFILWYP